MAMTTETEQELSNVVMFPAKDADPRETVGYVYEKADWCRHPGLYVNEKERQCRCQACNAVVDPFDYLLSLAKKETQFASTIPALRKEEAQRRANIEKLILIERNAKARITNASKRRNPLIKNARLSDSQIFTLRRLAGGALYQASGDGKRAREARNSGRDINAASIPILMRLGLVEFATNDKPEKTMYYRVRLTLEGQAAALDQKTTAELLINV